MKIALVLFTWFPHGGLQQDVLKIARALRDKGADPEVICMQWVGQAPENLAIRQAPPVAGSRVRRRRLFADSLPALVADGKYTAVLGFNRMPGLDFYFAADTCFAWKATRERSWLYRLTSRCRQYMAFEEAVFGIHGRTRILLLSEMQKAQYLACYPGSENRMQSLPPGIDRRLSETAENDDVRRRFRQEVGLADDEILLLQAGSGFLTKGLDRSIRAIAALPVDLRARVRLFVVGQGRVNRFRAMAEKQGIGNRVTFFGGRDDLPQFYRGADLLLHPSIRESAGMVILEAIVSGLPVLASGACGYAAHVEAAQAGQVLPEPFQQAAMDNMLREMLESPQRERWRHNGILYGRQPSLYDMPGAVADIILESAHGPD